MTHQEVVRYAKQVYTHLGLREIIGELSNLPSDWPNEVQLMQELHVADSQALGSIVRRFLQWNPNRPKTLSDFVQRIDNAIAAIQSFAEDKEEEDENYWDKVDFNSIFDEVALPEKRHISDDEDWELKRTCIDHEEPLSPCPDPVGLHDYVPGFNVLWCHKNRNNELSILPWVAKFEIARFLCVYRVPQKMVTFKVLQLFVRSAGSDWRYLQQTMLEWYTRTCSKSVHVDMPRCADQIWTKAKQGTMDANQGIHYGGDVNVDLYPDRNPIITLRPPQKGASNPFFRKFGDDRFLELKLDYKGSLAEPRLYKECFLKPFLLMGRTFRLLCIKDDTIVLFATEGDSIDSLSVRHVINWHIPILENWNVITNTFASNVWQGYNSSLSTVVFEPRNIRYTDDIYGGNGKDMNACLTDGCGVISYSAMRKVMIHAGFNKLPSVIQGRIGGANGIWILSPDLDLASGDWIEIRSSQCHFETGLPQADFNIDPLHYTFDLVGKSTCRYPSSLNTLLIQCLSFGGVSAATFVDLLEEHLSFVISIVTENQNGVVLRDWVAKMGGIIHEPGEAKDTSNAYSGNPSGAYESLIRLFDAGFDETNAYVANRVTHVFRDIMRSIIVDYKIEVQKSCTVTCTPDPTGTLKPQEIFLQFSSKQGDEITAIRNGLVIGDVIVAHDPCRLKSSIQKACAVDNSRLHMYSDVVIFSIHDKQSLASLLGGKYGGDIVFCCWDERIVAPFMSSPPGDVPERVDAAFDKTSTTVRQNLGEAIDETSQELILQRILLSTPFQDGRLDLYENWRTALSEMTAFDDEKVVYLAHVCARLADGYKQGLVLRSSIYHGDRVTFENLPYPTWLAAKSSKRPSEILESDVESPSLDRGPVTTMDYLYDTLKKETEAFVVSKQSMLDENVVSYQDPDLCLPWQQAWDTAEQSCDVTLLNDLKKIQQEIDDHHKKFKRDAWKLLLRQERQKHARHHSVYDDSKNIAEEDTHKYNTLFELEEYGAEMFQKIPTLLTSSLLTFDRAANHGQILETIKASYAYIQTIKDQKYSRYCYIMAFDILCRIKVNACARLSKRAASPQAFPPANALR